jgi:TetR/AcrR family transcriptional regulator, transcriptional repressor for nem operon
MARARPARSPARAERTRTALVDTAVRVFNQVGYWGTDSNSLAREAGYSPGTFYRHFTDKRAIFLAAFQVWADAEHDALLARVSRASDRGDDAAAAFVDFLVEHHARWRTFRASMRALAASDPALAEVVRERRRRHLALLRDRLGSRDLAGGLVVLYALDGIGEAVAAGEPRHLGVRAKDLGARVRGMIVGERARLLARRG